ncbi:hypothetical protein BH11PSE2_BH11PSE2_08720 [soil metagenome]
MSFSGKPARRARFVAVGVLVIACHLLVGLAMNLGPPDAGASQVSYIEIGLFGAALTMQPVPVEAKAPARRTDPAIPAPEAPPEPPPPPPDPSILPAMPKPSPPAAQQVEADGAEATPSGPTIADRVAVALAKQPGEANGQSCRFTETLQAVLQDDPEFRLAMAKVPRPSRSVANAIMLWNGAWTDPSAPGPDGVGAMQAAIMEGVRAAPLACQQAPLHGPLFMIMPDEPEATILVLGAADWRWADTLDQPVAPNSILDWLKQSFTINR